MGLEVILFRVFSLMWQSWAKLNIWYSDCHELSNSIQGWLLNWRASMASSLYFLIQFMES